MPESQTARLQLCGITKQYPGCLANDRIDLSIQPGEIHALLGENGAGKSTLMKIIYGVTQPDAGAIHWQGERVTMRDPAQARERGIGMVFQHFSLFETLSVAENIALALGAKAGTPKQLEPKIREVSQRYGMPLEPQRLVHSLSIGERQRVEIVRCLMQDIRLLILDEPTSVLTPQEADELFVTLRRLAAEGCSILFISHKLNEVRALCQSATVLRAGRVSGECIPAECSDLELARLMVGDAEGLEAEYPKSEGRAPFLRVERLSWHNADPFGVSLEEVDLEVRAGEIVGIAGVAGNGQSELLEALSGIRRAERGRVVLCGRELDPAREGDPAEIRRIGCAHVPEDRHHMGLVLPFEENENAILGYQDDPRYRRGLLLDQDAMRRDARDKITAYDIRPADCRLKTANFSGGNQQKIVLAREMERDPDVLLIGQPTRGVDVGAIEAIHRRLIELRDAGKAILLVSVELEEILALSDRIAVMFDGQIMGERAADQTDEKELGLLMAGITDTENEHSVAEVEANLARAGGDARKEV